MGAVVVESSKTVLQQQVNTEYISQESAATVVVTGQIGPRGLPGPTGPGGGAAFPITTSIPIGGGRVVAYSSTTGLEYASPLNPLHQFNILGITEGAAEAGAQSSVIRTGPLTDSSWNWALNQPIYLGLNGTLTQTPPSSGFLQIVAVPVTATKIFISIREPIVLA